MELLHTSSNTYLQGYWRVGRGNYSFSPLAFCEQLHVTAHGHTSGLQLMILTPDSPSLWVSQMLFFAIPGQRFDLAALTTCSLTICKEQAVPLAPQPHSASQAPVLVTLFLAICTKVGMASLTLLCQRPWVYLMSAASSARCFAVIVECWFGWALHTLRYLHLPICLEETRVESIAISAKPEHSAWSLHFNSHATCTTLNHLSVCCRMCLWSPAVESHWLTSQKSWASFIYFRESPKKHVNNHNQHNLGSLVFGCAIPQRSRLQLKNQQRIVLILRWMQF